MPIAALPLNTVLAIGSTQVLSDSASLVKELVENALDARASAIFVEISVNVLDVIQVKDNGHGIAPNDRHLVGRRYCTSKISQFEDLANIGGTSLGFRGEALASAIELSEGMTLTTRVEGEQVASSISFDTKGEVVGRQTVSHPVGTTVRVIGFLKNLPVRRQTALKVSAKLHSKIKGILEGYALARPSVRFSLRVLKANNDKANWTYAPKVGASVMDAAMKVLGQLAVAQCQWHVWSPVESPNQERPATSATDEPEPDSTCFSIEALLPRPECDISTVSYIGQHISIDSRPVSCCRGALKQVASLYKSYIRSGSFRREKNDKVVNPILCLNISCPPGSYDANVEPAKDDVLFVNPKVFLDIIETFFTKIYGELNDTVSHKIESKQQRSKPQEFELLLNRKPASSVVDFVNTEPIYGISGKRTSTKPFTIPASPKISFNETMLTQIGHTAVKTIHPNDVAQHSGQSGSQRGPAWKSNMYDFDSDEDLVTQGSGDLDPVVLSEGDDEKHLRDARVSNPWTIAKMIAPIRDRPPERRPNDIADCNGQLPTPARQKGEYQPTNVTPQTKHESHEARDADILPSPGHTQLDECQGEPRSPSPDRFNFPIRAWGPGNRHKRLTIDAEQTREVPVESILDNWVQRDQSGSNSFVSARTLPAGTPLDAIPEISQASRREASRKHWQKETNVNQTFQPPVTDPHRVWFDIGSTRQSGASRRQRAEKSVDVAISTKSVNSTNHDEVSLSVKAIEPLNRCPPDPSLPIHPDLAITLDYEVRKQAATLKRKELLRQQARDSTTPSADPNLSTISYRSTTSPHKNRYNRAIADLSTPTSNTEPSPFPPNDPRSYLLQLQDGSEARRNTGSTNAQTGKLKRGKTSLLPLETIPVDEYVHTLVFNFPVSTLQLIDRRMRRLAIDDGYTRTGKEKLGIGCCTDVESQSWSCRLRELVLQNSRIDIPDGAIEKTIYSSITPVNLETILRNHEEMITDGLDE